MAEPILEISALRLSYRVRGAVICAADGVGLVVREGEAVGLVGESGSGKSTLARAALGLLPEGIATIDSGCIRVAGQDVTHFTQDEWERVRGHPVAMVFQDPLSYLNPVMHIGRQIAESVRRHTPELPIEVRVAELLSLVKLPPGIVRSYPHELSGGMRQRVLLAIALGCRPRLLIADEPTTALDVTTQAEILALLDELRLKLGMALLLISHDLANVASACERIYVMYAGRTVEWGPTPIVFGSPAHPYTVGLLKAATSARDADGRFAAISGDPPNLAELPAGCPFAVRCPYAMVECSQAMPEPVFAQDMSHAVSCWRYHDVARGRGDSSANG